ncbi:MAG: hypothetical protein IPM16_13370 [Chloroflexi bacterium]|nr:hypothetical protein [Chloroflexota bacterium]
MITRHRRSIRLQGYDYTQSGAYFVTICTRDRTCLFGEIADGTMTLNPVGEVVQACWDAIPTHFPTVELDAFVVMPNHVHGILVITDDWKDGGGDSVGPSSVVGATDRSPHMHQDKEKG